MFLCVNAAIYIEEQIMVMSGRKNPYDAMVGGI